MGQSEKFSKMAKNKILTFYNNYPEVFSVFEIALGVQRLQQPLGREFGAKELNRTFKINTRFLVTFFEFDKGSSTLEQFVIFFG